MQMQLYFIKVLVLVSVVALSTVCVIVMYELVVSIEYTYNNILFLFTSFYYRF